MAVLDESQECGRLACQIGNYWPDAGLRNTRMTPASCFSSHAVSLPTRVYLPKRNMPILGGYEVTVIMGKKTCLMWKQSRSLSVCTLIFLLFYFWLCLFSARLSLSIFLSFGFSEFLGPSYRLFCFHFNLPPCCLFKPSYGCSVWGEVPQGISQKRRW